MQNFRTKIIKAKLTIQQAIKEFGDDLAVACSFGKDSMALVHLCQSIKTDIQIFTVLTPFKFPETYEYANKMTSEWDLNVKNYGYYYNQGVEVLERLGLPHDYPKSHSKECCLKFKVEPFRKAIKELRISAMIAGLRKDEGHTRKDCKHVETKQGLTKYNPILDFTELDVWKYLAINEIPPHPLYAKGYRSLGCEPCTGLCDDSEGERSGRWKNSERCGGECAIHRAKLK